MGGRRGWEAAPLFGPGDIAVAHTTRVRLPVEGLLESGVGYVALVM